METFDLVFEAGGAKGVAFIGALEVLFRSGHKARRLIGTSAGAITATCVAAGYSPQELLDAAKEKRDGKPTFSSFLDPPALEDFTAEMRENSELKKLLKSALRSEPIDRSLKKLPPLAAGAVRGFVGELARPLQEGLLHNPRCRLLCSLVETGGLYLDRRFLDWIRDQLRKKEFPADITLAAFHAKTQRDLSLAAADTTNKELLILNHRTAPDCPVYAAVRMSMSIPFVWPEVVWNKEWGTYRGRDKVGSAFVDGSVLSNFPLRYLVDGDSRDVRDIMGPAMEQKARPLGLLLDETKPIPGVDPMPNKEESKLEQRISRLVETVIGSWDQETIARYPGEICRIGAKGVGVLEFDMKEDRLESVVNSGRCAMTDYLKNRGFGLK